MCFVESQPSVVKVYAPQAFDLVLDLVGKEKEVEQCKVFIRAMEAILSRRSSDKSAVPAG